LANVEGPVRNGLMDGTWYVNYTPQYFKDGKYIQTDERIPIPNLTRIVGYDEHEDANIFDFAALALHKYDGSYRFEGINVPDNPPIKFSNSTIESSVSLNKSDKSRQPLQYLGNQNVQRVFIEHLALYLDSAKVTTPSNFWILLQFTVTPQNVTDNVSVLSSNKQIEQAIKDFIVKNKAFTAPVANEKEPSGCEVFLCFFMENGKLYLPRYNFDRIPLNF
jgi:hypothetical protein